MKITELTPSVSRAGGGLMDSVRRLSQEIDARDGYSVEVVSFHDDHSAYDARLWYPVRLRLLKPQPPKRFGFTRRTLPIVKESDADILHTHGLWTHLSMVAYAWSQEGTRPYVLSPQGMLEPWALNNSRLSKRIALRLFERAHLENARCLHAFAAKETESYRAVGLQNPICVIPNGVDVPGTCNHLPPAEWKSDGRRVLLYLGRLHPKKGLPVLVEAWHRVRQEASAAGWRLVIAGWDQQGHQAKLEAQVQYAELSKTVNFAGPLFDAAKASALSNADALILPSYGEGLPLVVLEAWAHRTPVLMTPQCNIPEGFTAAAAQQIRAEPASLATSLLDLFSMSPHELRTMGENGRRLVERRFTWTRVAEEMAEVYRWSIGGGPAPHSVQFD